MKTPLPLIAPFAGLRPRDDLAPRLSAPPYDVLNSREARQMAEGNPVSFLRVSKAEIELPPEMSPHDPAVYSRAAENFSRLQREGMLRPDPAPRYYVYRLVMAGREQVGVVAAASVDAYDSNRIRKHEHTRPDKEDDRTRFALSIHAHSGPVFLTYRQQPAIDALVAQVRTQTPVYDFVADDGIAHTLWVVERDDLIRGLSAAFDALPMVYVADGHHRSAAASRVCRQMRAENPIWDGSEPFNRFLAVLFPDNQMRILDYNRVVRDLNGLTPETFLERVGAAFEITPAAAPVRPEAPHRFGMYLGGRWHHLTLRPAHVAAAQEDPVARLDVSLLDRHLLHPILGIADPRRDPRIDFVGGIRGLGGLTARVDSGEMQVAFSLHPTGLGDLMAVADAGEVMPPKSTWFEPKLRDGLVIQTF